MTSKPNPPAASHILTRPSGPSIGLLFLLLAASVVLLLTLAGCAGKADQEPVEVGVEPEVAAVDDPAGLGTGGTMTTGGAMATGQPAPDAGATVVNVNLHARMIMMPSTIALPAGSGGTGEVTFVVTNDGDHEHSFEIEGNGIERELDSPLQPGESANLTVSLQPGTYTVYCPVGNHQEEGMETEVEITG